MRAVSSSESWSRARGDTCGCYDTLECDLEGTAIVERVIRIIHSALSAAAETQALPICNSHHCKKFKCSTAAFTSRFVSVAALCMTLCRLLHALVILLSVAGRALLPHLIRRVARQTQGQALHLVGIQKTF